MLHQEDGGMDFDSQDVWSWLSELYPFFFWGGIAFGAVVFVGFALAVAYTLGYR